MGNKETNGSLKGSETFQVKGKGGLLKEEEELKTKRQRAPSRVGEYQVEGKRETLRDREHQVER